MSTVSCELVGIRVVGQLACPGVGVHGRAVRTNGRAQRWIQFGFYADNFLWTRQLALSGLNQRQWQSEGTNANVFRSAARKTQASTYSHSRFRHRKNMSNSSNRKRNLMHFRSFFGWVEVCFPFYLRRSHIFCTHIVHSVTDFALVHMGAFGRLHRDEFCRVRFAW